ncbi:Cell death regulator Aven [Camelus dromedarius]|nr:Cell death regulator Aven [Camelus dromedarius]KAB1276995.1 Cell death regulator Aven [Camelus dromedarius]
MIVVLMDHRENEMVLEEQENDEISKTRLCSELGVVLACSWSVVFSEEEASRNPAFYVDCESLARALQELPLSLRLNIAAELVQTALPLELPQVKPKRNDDGKGLGKQLKGPLGPGGKGSLSELKSAAAGCATYPGKGHLGPGPSQGPQNPATLLLSAVDHLEEELDLLLNLDAPVKEGGDLSSDQTAQDLGSEKDGEAAQEEKDPARASVLEEKNVESKQPSISKSVTEEELEDWLDSMIS